MWKIGSNTNISIIIYTHVDTEHVSNSGTVRGGEGGRRRVMDE
jgi:hypothetical protein